MNKSFSQVRLEGASEGPSEGAAAWLRPQSTVPCTPTDLPARLLNAALHSLPAVRPRPAARRARGHAPHARLLPLSQQGSDCGTPPPAPVCARPAGNARGSALRGRPAATVHAPCPAHNLLPLSSVGASPAQPCEGSLAPTAPVSATGRLPSLRSSPLAIHPASPSLPRLLLAPFPCFVRPALELSAHASPSCCCCPPPATSQHPPPHASSADPPRTLHPCNCDPLPLRCCMPAQTCVNV